MMTTLALDNQQRFGSVNVGHHLPYATSPQFTNPWSGAASAAAPNHSIYAPSHSVQPSMAFDHLSKQQPPRVNSAVSMASYASLPINTASAGSSLAADDYSSHQMLTTSQDLLNPNRASGATGYGNEPTYTSAASPIHNAYAPPTAPYESMGYAPAPVRSAYAMPQDTSRRLSQPSVHPDDFQSSDDVQRAERQRSLVDFHNRALQNEARSFGDAIDASRGMIAMSQNSTPRNIYGPQGRAGRGSGDSYGFPSTHSQSSSISSTGTYPSYFGGSVDSSVSDYSNAGSDMDSVSSRTLPRPPNLLAGTLPPAPQSMMGQFSSKVSSSTQKKHKCKVCDKRFTRPSSLQTHMYSHTGEKPFSCEVEGCGRHFSVVSNLRRHRKVHKGEAHSEAGSEDHQSDH